MRLECKSYTCLPYSFSSSAKQHIIGTRIFVFFFFWKEHTEGMTDKLSISDTKSIVSTLYNPLIQCFTESLPDEKKIVFLRTFSVAAGLSSIVFCFVFFFVFVSIVLFCLFLVVVVLFCFLVFGFLLMFFFYIFYYIKEELRQQIDECAHATIQLLIISHLHLV